MVTSAQPQTPPQYLPDENSSHGAHGPIRSATDEYTGKKRKLIYPPAPQPSPVPVVDNHAHLDFRDGLVQPTPTEVMDAAASVNVVGAIQVATDLASAQYTIKAIEDEPRLRGALAIHPNDTVKLAADGTLDQAIDTIRELAAHPAVVCIGETGLDYYRTEGDANWEIQKYAFKRHIEMAVELGLALQIHDREAHDDVIATLLSMDRLPEHVVFHSYSGDEHMAAILNEHGWYASFSGVVTFKNNDSARRAAQVMRPELLLVETDSPFLTPHPHRGRPNAPYLVPHTLYQLAETRQQSVEDLGSVIFQNTERVYGKFEID
ncbi:TatD family hydrolase [Enteractinococcus coprophilus]|uniref:TatD DNase family protein n=1 Tax=Enteractinococcus coprophilus TaxID=1027633 RepID=A0A543AFG9_9MICC|nr:TatD family hydrolase [Enteractinococcus coprophilus]TQL71276.1 TatD DNase family protein [Enteractinococcus coprophilus]